MKRGRTGGFTLAELLVVMTVMVILFSLASPAIRGLTGGTGRRAAVNMVVSGIEQARVLAATEGAATYLAVADVDRISPPPDSASAASLKERYHFRAFAVFREDNSTAPVSYKQISPWRSLPPSISFRRSSQLAPGSPNITFPFTPGGAQATISSPFLKISPLGEVTGATPTGPALIRIYQGFAATDREIPADPQGNETIAVSRFTGRATYQSQLPAGNP
ncbi:MAG: prepilin-type N-terminal cleavage/methylation domain-containing protein [Verrucomicrobia bacterium]|nr:prepilin-type N-terminal cleavage/methylation domain-containing protein [Verrucomicrobiota bacterium]